MIAVASLAGCGRKGALDLPPITGAAHLVERISLVPLVAGRRGRNASTLLAVAALMTNVWFPSLYRDYVNVLAPGSIARPPATRRPVGFVPTRRGTRRMASPSTTSSRWPA